MGMTLSDIRTEVARRARMNTTNATHSAKIDFWINRAQEEISNHTEWEWALAEYSLTYAANDRLKAMPTTDVNGNAYICKSIDNDSVRTTSRKLDYISPSDIVHLNRSWSLGTVTGAVTSFTIVGGQIGLYKVPTTSTVVYFNGWREPTTLTDDTDESFIPSQWRESLILGATHRAMDERGHPNRDREKRDFDQYLEQMVGRQRFVRNKNKRVRPSVVWHVSGRRSSNVIN